MDWKLTWDLPDGSLYCSGVWALGFLPGAGVQSLNQDEGAVWMVVMFSLDMRGCSLPSEAAEQTTSHVRSSSDSLVLVASHLHNDDNQNPASRFQLIAWRRKEGLPSSTTDEFQHPCRDRNDSHTLIQCTVDAIYWSACVVIYIFHICTRNHAYSDRLQT